MHGNSYTSLPFEENIFLTGDVDMNIVEPEFIYDGVVIFLISKMSKTVFIKLNHTTSKILQSVYAGHSIGPSKDNRYSVLFIKGEGMIF